MADLVASATVLASAEGPSRLVELAGEADMTSTQLKDVLDAEVAAGPPLLVLDLSQLTFMDSWALHVILAGRAETARLGRNTGPRRPFRSRPAGTGTVRGRHHGRRVRQRPGSLRAQVRLTSRPGPAPGTRSARPRGRPCTRPGPAAFRAVRCPGGVSPAARPDAHGALAGRLHDIEVLADAALSRLDEQRLLETLLERFKKVLQADTATVLLLDNRSASHLVATAASGIEEGEVSAFIRG